MNITQCSAPTNGIDDEEKDNFYLSIQAEVETKPATWCHYCYQWEI